MVAFAFLCSAGVLSAQQILTLNDAEYVEKRFDVGYRQYRFFEWDFPSPKSDPDRLVIAAVEAVKGTYDLHIMDVRQEGNIPDLLGPPQCLRGIALTNGGYYFVKPNGKNQPTGLAISNGVVLSPLTNPRWGGFVIWNGDQLDVRRVSDVSDATKARNALQSSPIIIWGGQIEISPRDKAAYNRTAIGVTTSSDLVLVGAFTHNGNAISQYAFAQLARGMGLIGGPKIQMLLGLDGGPSSHLYIPALDKRFGYSGKRFLPNALCVSQK
jgi:hypothetical protein